MIQMMARLLVPPACVGCRLLIDPDRSICDECLWELDASGPIDEPALPGVDAVVSVSPHAGVGRSILSAYKFNGLFGLGDFIAARMSEAAPVANEAGRVVPVPAAAVRSRLRGFDTADELSGKVADWVDWPCRSGTLARIGLGRQRGRGRKSRLSDPPKVEARSAHSGTVLLVDDVLTTGATLSTCARVLRESGAERVLAVTFTRRL
ncbi:MAG: ComF family protein [Solirubrobacterales bacterium]